MSPRWLALALLAAAAATTDVFTEDGQRQGRIVEQPSGSIDLFNADSQRRGWGRTNADGSADLFAPNGQRLGTITPGGKIWINRSGKGGAGRK